MEAVDVPLVDASSPRSGGQRSKPWSRCSSIGRSSGSITVEYTSLRDVLGEEGGGEHGPQSWRAGGSWGEPYPCCLHDDVDPSANGIRNQLLKRAASAYLQSAVAVAARGDDGECCLARLWRRCRSGGGRRGRGRVLVLVRAARSWQGCVDDPAELCAAFVARSARRFVAFVAERVAGVLAR